MTARMRFQVLGIPVTVDWFFLIGLVMIWSWAGSDRGGLFAALLVGVFTLLHELGHALTARRFGAQSAIRLNLLVGWASYSAPRPLSRRQRNLISLAGPLTQIVLAIPLLVVTYLALPAQGSSESIAMLRTGEATMAFDLWQGAVWAGITIGLLNLLPLWPLDGGHVLDSVLTKSMGDHRGRRTMLIGTLIAVGAIAVLGYSTSNLSSPYSWLEREVINARLAPYAALYESLPAAIWRQVRYFPGRVFDFPLLLLIFCGLNSFATLRRTPKHDRAATWVDVAAAPPTSVPAGDAGIPAEAVLAERTGWLEGTVGNFPAGWGPSPWLQAYAFARRGESDEGRRCLSAVVAPGRPRWTLPDPGEHSAMRSLLDLLPSPLPIGDPNRSVALLRVLAAHGTVEQIAAYGVALYSATHESEALYLTAAGLARCDRGDDAMAWLRRAVQDRPDHHRLATDRALWPLHGRVDFQQLLAEARRASR